MPDWVVDPSVNSAKRTHLSIIVPLALERQCLNVGPESQTGPVIDVFQSGQGAANARRAARAALAGGATALMSVGVAGALVADLEAGDAIVPQFVIDARDARRIECSTIWCSELRKTIASVCTVSDGAILGVSDVLTRPSDKQAAASRYAAVACDMESAAVAAVAADAGVHFCALRIISDTYEDKLPDSVADWVDDTGKARVLPVLGELRSPARWRGVVTMVSRFHMAQRRLNQLSELLVSAAYCCPHQ
jgi:adenosylhomocysteine nucleosidase